MSDTTAAEECAAAGYKGNQYIYLRMFTTINQYIQQFSAFTPDEVALFNSLLEHRTVPKKTFLLQEGEVCRFEGFINKGCIRSYYVDEQGAEITLQFAIENWWVSDIASFHEQQPSRLFIETLEDSELLMLNPDTKEQLLQQVPRFERMFRLMVQRNLSRLQQRLFQTIATTAEQKYLDFLERYPTIPQRAPQHQIASFLGFSPEFLSKVRTRLAKK
ncbi:Crp/Fnr family transcriptional regulator [Chitinophaga horti]|uniref:Crp/Fnr family transcriptional regulator n=1 Tax=Chitinophaga horti TaxID=2920382 RepID=A0ABY6IVI2_9BACT|nr:Crp/Fnr family transcriptional regulator [Chitinophaga horti]UYQ91385.1 Crp/Fnr family transcriptional regulator [Chitinophaga horti]